METIHLLGRVLIGGFFVYNGINHLALSSGQLTEYARSRGTPAPRAAVLLSGALLLAGGLSVLLGWEPRWGVLLLTLFLVPVSFQMHRFWREEGEEAQNDMVHFMKNMALLGALWMMLIIPQPWPWSLAD